MKVKELYLELGKLIEQGYGEDIVINNSEEEFEYIDLQKFMKKKYIFNDEIIEIDTEDLDENYLEEWYDSDGSYRDRFVSKGICVKIY